MFPRTMSRWLLSISKEGGATTYVQPVPVLSNPPSKEVFPDVQRSSCVSVCTLTVVLSLGTTEKAWLHPLFAHCLQIFVCISAIAPEPSPL